LVTCGRHQNGGGDRSPALKQRELKRSSGTELSRECRLLCRHPRSEPAHIRMALARTDIRRTAAHPNSSSRSADCRGQTQQRTSDEDHGCFITYPGSLQRNRRHSDRRGQGGGIGIAYGGAHRRRARHQTQNYQQHTTPAHKVLPQSRMLTEHLAVRRLTLVQALCHAIMAWNRE
jgi:hypothetical protein